MRRRERGVALLLVLGAVALLAALAVELAARANVEVMLSARAAKEAAYRRLCDSGTELGRGLLVEPEAKTFDFWGEPWNGEAKFTLGPGEEAVVRISDESGKINVGKAGNPAILMLRLGRLFEYLRRKEPLFAREWKGVEGTLLGQLGLLGSKDKKDAPRPTAPFTLDNLREGGLTLAQVFGKQGLARFLTTQGDGKINLNTAPRAVLYALDDELDETLVDRIASYRGDLDGRPGTYKAFEEPKDLELVDGIVQRTVVDGQPQVMRNLAMKIAGGVTTRSVAFSIRVEARVGDLTRQSWAFFEPSKVERAGKTLRRELKRIAFEEIRP
jgi:general secretion pathway protein K